MTLLDYARAPATADSPLPDLNLRRYTDRDGSRDWPVGLIAGPIAPDLIADGLTADSRGKLAAADGSALAPITVAERAADLLVEAARHLTDSARAAGWTRPDSLRPRPLTAAQRWHEEARGLQYTANALRTSAPAVRNFVERLKPRLPAPAAPRQSIDEFLARHDHSDSVKRSDLGREYVAEGSPGGLTRTSLYAVAEQRWGPVVKLDRGDLYFRPDARDAAASALSAAEPPVPPGVALTDALAALNARFGLDTVATAQEALSGYHDRVRDLLQRGSRLRALTLHREHHSR